MPELSIKIQKFSAGRTILISYRIKKKRSPGRDMSGVYDLRVATAITPLILYRKSNQINVNTPQTQILREKEDARSLGMS